MAFETSGYKLFRKTVTFGGQERPIYFFSKKPSVNGAEETEVPTGYEVNTNTRSGLPVLQKIGGEAKRAARHKAKEAAKERRRMRIEARKAKEKEKARRLRERTKATKVKTTKTKTKVKARKVTKTKTKTKPKKKGRVAKAKTKPKGKGKKKSPGKRRR